MKSSNMHSFQEIDILTSGQIKKGVIFQAKSSQNVHIIILSDKKSTLFFLAFSCTGAPSDQASYGKASF